MKAAKPSTFGKWLVLLAISTTMLTGCVAHSHRKAHAHSAGTVVVIDKGHVHSARCGHYKHAAKWYYVKGHVHGKKCGHLYVGGVWVIN